VDTIIAPPIRQLSQKPQSTQAAAAGGIRRTDPKFWEFSDQLQAAEAHMDQADRGLLDYNRLENR